MKKNFYLALMGAIALTGATGLTSCTDEETVVENVNPGYNAETGEVPVNFVLNVSKGVSTTTRMTAANTQADLNQTFRGIDNARLMAVKLGTAKDGKFVTQSSDYSNTTTTGEGEGATTTTTRNSKLFNLGAIMNNGSITQKEGEAQTSHRIFELSLPTETNALLFWGTAPKSTASDADHEQGKIKFEELTDMDIDALKIKLQRVVPEDADEPTNPYRRSAFLQYQTMIAAVLTKILHTEANIGTDSDPRYIGWVDYVKESTEGGKTKLVQKNTDPASTTDEAMSNMGEILAETYCTFNTIYSEELRAGSGSAIVHMMKDLRAVIEKVASGIAANVNETAAKRVATAIKNNIDEFFAEGNDGKWKIPSTIKEKCGLPAASLNLINTTEDSQDGTYSITNFPTFFHLPKGATILQFVKDTYTAEEAAAYNAQITGALNSTDELTAAQAEAYNTAISGASKEAGNILSEEEANNYNATLSGAVAANEIKKDARGNFVYKYQYMGSVPTYAMGGSTTAGTSNSAFDPRNYMYPPELCYFGNSPIRVTDDTHEAAHYPEGPSVWTTDASWTSGYIAGATGWTKNGHVLSTTRSVAMRDNINYGTALLETKIRYATDVLEDNNAAIQLRNTGATEANNKIDVTSNNLFILTGILVGGQHPVVGWNYIPKITPGEGSGDYGAMVYDRLGTDQQKSLTGATAHTGTEGQEGYVASVGGSNTLPTYTLVWDNWEEANKNKDQRIVYLALEFVNNSGKDFWGQNNLIRNGETFYITAKLDPNAAVSDPKPTGGDETNEQLAEYYAKGITWPTDDAPYALPPYDADGKTIKQRRVFIQDYKTVANLKLTKTSLQHALVAMPDLRSAQISLGLSVDLSWSPGLTFEDIELGAQ